MLQLQQCIRGQVNQDLDCSESSVRLMVMRTQMTRLIAKRAAIGGVETGVDGAARPRPAWRPELRRKLVVPKEKPGRSRVLAF